MAWQIEHTRTSLKQLSKLDKPAAKMIIDFMDERIVRYCKTRVIRVRR